MDIDVLKNGTVHEPQHTAAEPDRKGIDLASLKRAIAAADPNAVLVGHNIIRRVLQSQYKISPLSARVPKESCYVVDRQILFREVEQDELELGSDRILPPTVILIAKPTSQQMLEPREVVLRRFWRRLFEAHIHVTLRERMAEGLLTPADVRAHIEAIGHAEFEEIRTVLDQELRLLTPYDEVSVYLEFVVYYLELRYFLNNLRATYFPSIRDFDLIDQLVGKDVDGDTLFHRTRPEGAPDPEVRTDMHSDESRDFFLRVLRQAARAKKSNDLVRAAILYTKAARVAPAAETESTRETAHRCLDELIQNLKVPLKLDAESCQQWVELLPSLLDKADQGTWPDEAKLLVRLQNIWLENESPSISIDVVGYVLSAGRKALERELSGLQVVRATNHLRAAIEHLTQARIGNTERQRLAVLLHKAVERSEEMLRERFRPTLEAAFYDANLIAHTPPEQVAMHKIIEELLDRISEQGFFTFSDLRDCLSRNQLKLADLSDPHAFWQGSPLLHLDRRLADQLEGVYRHGEFYLRWLQSGGSLLFGTKLGRFITTNILLPFGGAALLLRGGEVLLSHFGGHAPVHVAETEVASASIEHASSEVVSVAAAHTSAVPIWAYPLLGLIFFLLMHWQPLREFLANWSVRTVVGLRLLCYEWPARLINLPIVQRLRRSWLVCMSVWLIVNPLIMCGVLYLYLPELFHDPYMALATFIASAIFLTLRLAKYIGQALGEMAAFVYSWFRFDLIRGLIWFTGMFFKQVTNAMEIVLYTVDEWLRFRGSQSLPAKILRGLLNVLWFPVGFLIRLYFVVLVETTINPLKLPFSSLAYKFLLLYPPYFWAASSITYHKQWLEGFLPIPLAWVFSVPILVTFWFLPGAFVFFLWELKENWKLFAANRPKLLRPVSIGHHGETVLQLLKPGFHSGVIPRAFARLRQAERQAYRTNNWRSARTYRQYLKEVARWVQIFVEREFLALLRQSKSWGNQPVSVRQIQLSCKRIRILLAHQAHPGMLLELDLEDRSGWLMASMPDSGWLRHLKSEQLEVMNSALAGLYKIAGVDFVQEQVLAALPLDTPEFDISDRYLIVWLDPTGEKRVAYDLRIKQEQLRPRSYMGKNRHAPSLDARQVFFSRIPLTWDQWVGCWRQDAEARGHPRLLSQGPTVRLLALSEAKKSDDVVIVDKVARQLPASTVNA